MGNFNSKPSLDAARILTEEIIPRLLRKSGDWRLLVLGQNPPRWLVSAQEKSPQLQVLGFVPDIRPWLEKCRLGISPITIGAGVKTKVLEMMAAGKPIVATTQSVRGLQVQHMNHLLIADDWNSFVEYILLLLDDDTLCRRIGGMARAYTKSCHGLDGTIQSLLRVYDRILAG